MPRLLKLRGLFALGGALYFALALLAPVLFAYQAESQLPMCCRRNGAHHCMMGRMDVGPGAGVSATGHCPAWPHALRAANTQAFVTTQEQTSSATLLQVAVVRVRNAELGRIARERQLSLRGPPTLVAV